MSPQKTRRILSVFLASPGDVVPEREIAVEVVNRINKSIRPSLGWQIDLHRWEDTKPAYGRPQSIINAAVDTCDLFIGLLWERWGQSTGAYTSGFHEEFERAKTRRESSSEPEIWLVFKTPRPDKLEDPGSELKKVLESRETQISLRQVLFKEVSDSEDWKTSLYDWLLEHILEHVVPATETAQQPPTEPPLAVQATEPTASNTDGLGEQPVPEVPEQLVDLSSRVSRVVSSGNLEFSRADANLLGEFDIARLYLVSATWMARRYTSDFLGIHEINLLYKHRGRLEVTPTEEYQILRTVLHDSSEVIPGWFWFRDAFPKGPSGILLFIATEDSNNSLRARALRLLTSARIQIPQERWTSLPLSDEFNAVSVEALNYLGFAGDESALTLIEKATQGNEDPLVSAAAMEARFHILVRINPKRAFSELISNGQHASAELVRAFTEVADALTIEDLIKGAEMPAVEIRKLSVTELARRGELPLELAERLREDSSIEVREIALQVIVNKRGEAELQKLRAAVKPEVGALYPWSGRKDVDLDSIASNYYQTLKSEQLLEAIRWPSVDGPRAYKALAVGHFDDISEFIRSDLDTGFERIREKYLERIKSEFGVEGAQRFSQSFQQDKLDDFIRSQYTEAALWGLGRHGQPSDIEIARKYLRNDNQKLRLAAAKIVSQFGDETDVPALLGISDEAWGELEDLAATSAIRLSPHPDRLAIEMAQSDRRGRNKAALRWLVDQDSAEVRDYFRGLLNDESESKRSQGVQYLSKRLSRTELEQLLDEFPGKETYYYNVVTWLDRLLYAPSSFKEMYTRNLDQEVGANQTS